MSIQYEFRFEPIKGTTYYDYQRPDNSVFVSILSPDEWGKEYIGTKITFLHKVTMKDGKPEITEE